MQIRTHLNTLERCGHSLVSLSFIIIMMMCRNVFEIDMVSFTTELFIYVRCIHSLAAVHLQTQPKHSENQKVCRLVRFN